MKNLPKLIIILGTTATGKTKLAIDLCKKFNGEVISADSRQVYKYMKIGTDRPQGKHVITSPKGVVIPWIKGLLSKTGLRRRFVPRNDIYFVKNIPHYLMNCIEPDENFSLADFKIRAEEIIYDINKRGKIPFLVGGTGMYISALVENWSIPKVKPNLELRQELESKSLEELVKMLKKRDPQSANIIDLQNPRRVLRALEVVLQSGQSFIKQKKKEPPLFDVLQIGLQRPREEIYERINKRIDQMIEEGLIEEIKQLLIKGYAWNLPAMSGLGYRQFKDYLEGKKSLEEAAEILKRDTRRYAKRQITWFKRDETINWLNADDNIQAIRLVEDFIR